MHISLSLAQGHTSLCTNGEDDNLLQSCNDMVNYLVITQRWVKQGETTKRNSDQWFCAHFVDAALLRS